MTKYRNTEDAQDGNQPAGGILAFLKLVLSVAWTILAFALPLSVILTVLLFGLKIIGHGIPMCAVLARENMLSHVLYTSCGCALVEIILTLISVLVLWKTAPRFLNLTRRIHAFQRERLKKHR